MSSSFIFLKAFVISRDSGKETGMVYGKTFPSKHSISRPFWLPSTTHWGLGGWLFLFHSFCLGSEWTRAECQSASCSDDRQPQETISGPPGGKGKATPSSHHLPLLTIEASHQQNQGRTPNLDPSWQTHVPMKHHSPLPAEFPPEAISSSKIVKLQA